MNKRGPNGENEAMDTNNHNLPGSNEEHGNLDPSGENEQSANNDENKKQTKDPNETGPKRLAEQGILKPNN